MFRTTIVMLVVVCTVLALGVAMPRTATADLMLAQNAAISYGNSQTYAQYTFGNQFTVGDAALNVTKLGYADWDGAGLTDSHQVGIWNMAGTLLTSATVPSGTGSTLLNNFRWVTLDTPLELAATTTYIIGGDTGAVANDVYGLCYPTIPVGDGAGMTIAGRKQIAGGFAYPGDDNLFTNSVWGGPNMEYTVVPEPSTWILLSIGTIGLLGYCRWRMK